MILLKRQVAASPTLFLFLSARASAASEQPSHFKLPERSLGRSLCQTQAGRVAGWCWSSWSAIDPQNPQNPWPESGAGWMILEKWRSDVRAAIIQLSRERNKSFAWICLISQESYLVVSGKPKTTVLRMGLKEECIRRTVSAQFLVSASRPVSPYSIPRSVLLHESLCSSGGFDLRPQCFPGVKTDLKDPLGHKPFRVLAPRLNGFLQHLHGGRDSIWFNTSLQVSCKYLASICLRSPNHEGTQWRSPHRTTAPRPW